MRVAALPQPGDGVRQFLRRVDVDQVRVAAGVSRQVRGVD
jgi:hypothetical protein